MRLWASMIEWSFFADGSVKWQYVAGGAIESSPVIGSDERIYIGTNDGKLYAMGTEVIEAIAGDINGDGQVTPGDALLAFEFFLGREIPTSEQFEAADMNKDGRITPGDALAIFEIFLGK